MTILALWKIDVAFPPDPSVIEQIALRWVHITAAIIWVGFLAFFLFAVGPALKAVDPETRGKIFPEIASRGLWWLRWSAFVAWVMGFRYFMILAQTDAINAGQPRAWGGWLGIWFALWIVAFAVEMGAIQALAGTNAVVSVTVALLIMAAASWLILVLLAHPGVSNRTLCISVGGGLGTILLLNIWGIAWRCQKRLIAWTRAASQKGAPMPADAAKLTRLAMLTMYINFALSLPTIFFMAASAHFPFLSGK